MIKACDYPECTRAGQFLMSWNNKNGKHFGMVCAAHDKLLGRENLVSAGMPIDECVLFERYCKETVKLDSYPDWPEWFEHHTGKVTTPLTPKRTFPSNPLTLLNLSPRVQNALRRNNITTIKQLANMNDYELLKIRTIGKIGLNGIRKSLKEFVDE